MPRELERASRGGDSPRVSHVRFVQRVIGGRLHRIVEPHARGAVQGNAVGEEVLDAPAVGAERGQRDGADGRVVAELRRRDGLGAQRVAHLVGHEDRRSRVQQRHGARLGVLHVARLEAGGEWRGRAQPARRVAAVVSRVPLRGRGRPVRVLPKGGAVVRTAHQAASAVGVGVAVAVAEAQVAVAAAVAAVAGRRRALNPRREWRGRRRWRHDKAMHLEGRRAARGT